jgi:hypothetical protein
MIIENIEFPAGAVVASHREKYPFGALGVGQGFIIANDKALSARSALSRFRKANPDVAIEVAVLQDKSLIVRRAA